MRDNQVCGSTTRRRRRTAGVFGVLVGALLFASPSLVPSAATAHQGAVTTSAPTAKAGVLSRTNAPTTVRLSSFNLLGAGHTKPGGNRKGWESGWKRMGWAVQLINEQQLDVIGFQEMQGPQFRRFMKMEGDRFGIFPGDQLTDAAMHNSIAWRKSEWTLVEARTLAIPYFRGNPIRMPYVLLQNVDTGHRAWFFNTHNPADARGPAQKWRDKGFRMEADLANRLRAESPTTPFFSTGDKNDREEYFCPLARRAGMQAANGGWMAGDKCVPPSPMKVDWIMGTSDAVFTGYRAITKGLISKVTDHPLVVSNATVASPEVAKSPIRRVLLISVEGLTSKAFEKYGPAGSPALHRMVAEGASTLNARTSVERTSRMSNLVGMLSGRRVSPVAGGHGVGWSSSRPETVHEAAGRYVSSAFDLVHNFGMRTAVFTSKSEVDLMDRSWDGRHGGTDPYGRDDGRNKISQYVRAADDAGLVTQLRATLAKRPAALTVAHLTHLDDTGHKYGWMRSRYAAALKETNRQVNRILKAVKNSPRTAGKTLVVLTSEHGGKGRSHADQSVRANYTVPFLVTGPGVPAGTDLYAMNPRYADPGAARLGYGGAQPIRNGFAANLTTMVLRLPALPGSTLNGRQDFTVLRPR